MWPSADHGEGIGAGKKASRWQLRDGLLAGVDEVRILVALERERAHPKHAVSRSATARLMPARNIVRHQRRNADAEIDVVAVLELLGGARRHLIAGPSHLSLPPKSSGCVALAGRALLDALNLVGHVHDPLNVNAGRDDVVAVELARLDEMLDLGHRETGRQSPYWD